MARPEMVPLSEPSSVADRLAQAEAQVRNHCGWHIAPSRVDVVEMTFRSHLARTVFLRSMHVTAVTSVTVGGVPVTDFTWTPDGMVQRRTASFYGDVVVTYTHGYAQTPADVAGVIQRMVQSATSNPTAVTSKTIGPFSESYAAPMTLTPADRAVLAAYQLPLVA